MAPSGKLGRVWAKSLLSNKIKQVRGSKSETKSPSCHSLSLLTASDDLTARSYPLFAPSKSITATPHRLSLSSLVTAGSLWLSVNRDPRRPAVATGFFRRNTLLATCAILLLAASPALRAQTDCLSCHSDVTMQDANGHNAGVNADTFHSSVHGTLDCSACHTSITAYPHPDHPSAVKCAACHADEAAAVVGSVHEHASDHPCTSCHGTAHDILPKDNPKSAVYPLNIPATCGKCHGDAVMARQHHLANVYPQYMDTIHGYAVSQEGLLVAANCESCHGSHHVLSHSNPLSPTYRTAIPETCGKCHGGILTQYMAGIHGQAMASGNQKAPVCTDCHTAHTIARPTMAQSTPVCGSCHQAQLSTYRDTFHSQVSDLGSYVAVARCSDCHGEHEILPASDPRSPVNSANLVKTCGRCHQNANAGFVKYEPHANPHNRKLYPVLFYIRLFMVLLISGVMTFFLLHSVLWLIRSLIEKAHGGSAKGDK
jgi:hypothetical protein